MSLKHRFVSAIPDGPNAALLRPSNWGSTATNYDTAPTHVFDGGADGALAMRDTDAIDGLSWLRSEAGVLVSDGDDEIPVFRALEAGDIPALPYAPVDLTGVVVDADIVSLAWSKLTGTPTSLAGYGIVDPIVLTSGAYADPAWITSLAWGKLTGTPTLGNSAALNVGTTAGTVAAGDHLHTGVYEPAFGTLGVAKGGTGLATFTVGDLPYASGVTALSKLAAVAVGSVLVSGGVGAAPAWSATPTVTTLRLTGGSDAVIAQTFTGPSAAGTAAYVFSVVPAEAAADHFNCVGTSYANVGDTRTNQVFKIGANAGPSLLQDAGDAGIMDVWESHWAPDANRYVERHITFVPAGAGTEVRLWTAMVNKATNVAAVSSVSDTWNWINRSDSVVRFKLGADSFLSGKLDLGPGNSSSTGQTLNVRDVAGATSVTVRAGGAQGGTDIFRVDKVNGTFAFKVDTAYDATFTAAVTATGFVASGSSSLNNVILGGFSGWLQGTGSITLRNSNSSGGIFFTSTAFAYDATDVSIVRSAAGKIAITDGSAGVGSASTYRDLQVRALLGRVVLTAGTATAGTAPFKFASGPALTTAESGAIEFTTDDFFATITTGAARKGIVLDDGARLTSGKIPRATTNGRLIDGPAPLAGTKTYWVSDTSGGVVNRKLTFTDGILTAEV